MQIVNKALERILRRRINQSSTATLSFDDVIYSEKYVFVDIAYDTHPTGAVATADCLFEAPATNENIAIAKEILERIKAEYGIEINSDLDDAESDEIACKIANTYFKKLSAPKLTNMVDVIAILLKGGHIQVFTPDFTNPKEVFYLVFIPVPDIPKKKTFVGHIAQKQFNELCNKSIITERKHLQHTDGQNRRYSFYQLAEDIILRFRGE